MQPAQALEPILAHLDAGLALELVCEQAAAHADLAMDAPDRELDAFAVEGLLPGQHVLVDAVDQRPVEVEQKHRLDAHRPLLLGQDAVSARAASTKSAMAPAPEFIVNRDSELACDGSRAPKGWRPRFGPSAQ